MSSTVIVTLEPLSCSSSANNQSPNYIDELTAPTPKSGKDKGRKSRFVRGHGAYDAHKKVPSDGPLRCHQCSGIRLDNLRSRHNQLPENTDYLGLIVYLPNHTLIPSTASCFDQWALNAGAYGHGCVVLLNSTCGSGNKPHQLFLAPITSFHMPIQEKYHRANEDRRALTEYVALPRDDTERHNEYPILDQTGPALPQQSYVHLDMGFWIEPRYLKTWYQKQDAPERRLKPDSLRTLLHLYKKEEKHWQSNYRRSLPVDTLIRDMPSVTPSPGLLSTVAPETQQRETQHSRSQLSGAAAPFVPRTSQENQRPQAYQRDDHNEDRNRAQATHSGRRQSSNSEQYQRGGPRFQSERSPEDHRGRAANQYTPHYNNQWYPPPRPRDDPEPNRRYETLRSHVQWGYPAPYDNQRHSPPSVRGNGQGRAQEVPRRQLLDSYRPNYDNQGQQQRRSNSRHRQIFEEGWR